MEFRNITAYYETRFGAPIRAVENVNLTLNDGEVLGIAGESGCGKSSLAAVLSSNAAPTMSIKSGTIELEGKPSIDVVRHRGVPPEWRGTVVSLLPQRALNSLNPTARVGAFAYDVIHAHEPKVSRREAHARAAERLQELGLPPAVLDTYPHQLSGGMRQRVVTVISTILNPTLLIADEPTSALDVSSQKALVLMLKRMMEQGIISRVIFITHDLALLGNIADRIAVMYAGNIIETGDTQSLFANPQHPYTSALLSSTLEPDVATSTRVIEGLPGSSPDMRNPPGGCRFHPRCKYAMPICADQVPDPITTETGYARCWLLVPDAVQQGKEVVAS